MCTKWKKTVGPLLLNGLPAGASAAKWAASWASGAKWTASSQFEGTIVHLILKLLDLFLAPRGPRLDAHAWKRTPIVPISGPRISAREGSHFEGTLVHLICKPLELLLVPLGHHLGAHGWISVLNGSHWMAKEATRAKEHWMAKEATRAP